MTLQPIPSEFPYIRGIFSFLFYQCINSKYLSLPVFEDSVCYGGRAEAGGSIHLKRYWQMSSMLFEKGSVASLCRIHLRTNINLILYRIRTKRTYLFWKAHKLKSQGVKHFKKSVFLAKGLEREYKPQYSQNKVILTWFRPLPRPKLWKVGLIGLTSNFFPSVKSFIP